MTGDERTELEMLDKSLKILRPVSEYIMKTQKHDFKNEKFNLSFNLHSATLDTICQRLENQPEQAKVYRQESDVLTA
jgi:hypothetical protein